MTAEKLMQRYAMQEHVENGAFIERHYPYDGPGRASSGSIYYYVAPGEWTQFHQIDCDEYWCYVEGTPLEIWQVEESGRLTVSRLGVEDGCEPMVYLKSGVIFASKSNHEHQEGTFLACVTVPRFRYEGFRLIDKETMLKDYSCVKNFYPGAM